MDKVAALAAVAVILVPQATPALVLPPFGMIIFHVITKYRINKSKYWNKTKAISNPNACKPRDSTKRLFR